jgi:orotate phosphoribosyltransferase
MQTKNCGSDASLRTRAFNLIRQRSFSRGKFILASGRESEFYLDLKPTMFHPEGAHLLAELIFRTLDEIPVDYIGGLAMGAVPLVAAVNLISHLKERPLPGFFVRKTIKDHGTKRRIEAVSDLAEKRVVILEDVTTTGSSAMEAVRAARDAGGNVVLVLSVVDREEGAAGLFDSVNVRFERIFQLSEFASTAM